MTIDKAKLKALAEAVAELEDVPERQDEHAEAVDALWLHMHCHTILGLLAEIDQAATDGQDAWGLAQSRAETIDQLKAENEAFKAANAELSEINVDRRNHLANAKKAAGIEWDGDLVGAIEMLRKDAERYRWLRDGSGYCDTRDIPGMAPARMDAFIDAAMSKEATSNP